MTNRHKEEGTLDVTEVGLVMTGAAVGGAAGAGFGLAAALMAKAPKVLQRGYMARQARFIERIAHYLEEQDPDGAAEFIASHSETAEFADTLERGYEAMRRALDPATEECICLLTADHARQGKPTDRRFVRAAALLEACDLSTLRTLNLITTAYVATGDEVNNRWLFHGRAGQRNARGGQRMECPSSFFITTAYSNWESERASFSGHFPAPRNLRRLLVDLAHYDYGEEWASEMGRKPPQEIVDVGVYTRSKFLFSWEHHDAVHALHSYLAPVRLMMATDSPDDEQEALLKQAVLLEEAVKDAEAQRARRAAFKPPNPSEPEPESGPERQAAIDRALKEIERQFGRKKP